jgi:putative acetyltransferase
MVGKRRRPNAAKIGSLINMNDGWMLRVESTADIGAIGTLTEAAFRDKEFSQQTEQHIVTALREAGALTISLVADRSGEVIGHIAFSPVTISDGTQGWFCLGPVSVVPEYQGQGVGSALIREGLARLRQLGAGGCVLIGHPTYYPRFGFGHHEGLTHDGVPPEVFFCMSFDGTWPHGTVTEHPAFQATGTEEGE